MNTPTKIIVHHTGGSNQDPLADTSHHTFETVDKYHKSLGWGKIGYHYFIEKNGRVQQGRLDHETGAHTIGENNSSLGICLAGNFDATLPTVAQIESLKKLLIEKTSLYQIPANKILPHRTFSPKTCYGKKLSNTWAAELLEEQSIIALQLQIRILQLRIQIARLLSWK